jgi:SAM-dependent methyltransferase
MTNFGLSDETVKGLVKWAFATGGSGGAHVTRYAMYRALKDVFGQWDSPSKQVLAISKSRIFGVDVLGLKKSRYVEADYPEFNILHLPFDEDAFDFCISDQVLEHIEGDPFAAFKETVRVLKPGGYLCHTTCFVNGVHAAPKDFWRFTPAALELLAVSAGCKTIQCAGWGNAEAWSLISLGHRFDRIPDNPEHPLHLVATRSDPLWPIVVWIVAQKPLIAGHAAHA